MTNSLGAPAVSRRTAALRIFLGLLAAGAVVGALWAWLAQQKRGVLGTRAIKWNFTKFLVGRDGQVLRRFAPSTPPSALRSPIEQALVATA